MLKDLLKISLFASMSEIELSQLAEIIEVKNYKKGDVMFWEGEPARGLHYIKQGAVQMSKTNYEGKQAILQIFGAGDVLAEAVLFADAPYPATAEAIADTSVYFMGTQAMQVLMLEHPKIALYIIKVLSNRLRTAQDKLKTWAFASAENRVAKLLLELAGSHGKQGDLGLVVEVELPHARLAALSGLTRETVSRVLSSWRSEGLIETKQRRIVIKDIGTLKEYIKE
jgi:CRP/FNR family transcriptional regulator